MLHLSCELVVWLKFAELFVFNSRLFGLQRGDGVRIKNKNIIRDGGSTAL